MPRPPRTDLARQVLRESFDELAAARRLLRYRDHHGRVRYDRGYLEVRDAMRQVYVAIRVVDDQDCFGIQTPAHRAVRLLPHPVPLGTKARA